MSPATDDSAPGRMLALILGLALLVWGVALGFAYIEGVREGRRQVTAQYAQEIRRLNTAMDQEQIKRWLQERGQ